MIEIADITIGERHRKDLGDIAELAKSIEEIGLLQPIGLDTKNRLIFGGRRLEAYKKLGRQAIPYVVLDIPRIVDGEYAENILRKDFTITERVAIADAVSEEMGERRGNPTGNNQHIREERSKVLDNSPRDHSGDTSHIAAKKAGIGSRENLRKAKEVIKAAKEDPENFGNLPEMMDRTGRVNSAYGKLKIKQDKERILSLVPAAGKFRTLVIDPPWDFDNGTPNRGQTRYNTMKQRELLALDVGAWADESCHLWLCATNYHLRDAMELMEKWGFVYKDILTWVKPRMGMGVYLRKTTEPILFGVKGKIGIQARDIPSHFCADVLGHSEKPEELYDIVRRASLPPFGEVFQRKEREDFTSLFTEKQKQDLGVAA